MTGFGLIGHLLEMLQYDYQSDVCKVTPRDQKIAAQLVMKDIPTLTGIPSNTILLIHAHTYTYTHTDTYTHIYTGAEVCVDNGVTSSLHVQNVRSSKAIANTDEEIGNFKSGLYPLLFDPQTAGRHSYIHLYIHSYTHIHILIPILIHT